MLGAGGEEARNFVRFNSTMIIDGKKSQVVGFAHPQILFELGGTKLHGFIDATFDVVPHPFSQLIVIMLYFSKYDLYVPAYYVLMTVRRWLYPQLVYLPTHSSAHNFLAGQTGEILPLRSQPGYRGFRLHIGSRKSLL